MTWTQERAQESGDRKWVAASAAEVGKRRFFGGVTEKRRTTLHYPASSSCRGIGSKISKLQTQGSTLVLKS